MSDAPSTDGDKGANSNAVPAWSAYQEDVATFFRSLGLHAQTNVRTAGARGSHDIDVLVEFTSAGIAVTWVVECKQWSRPVGKDKVLVLAGVMADIGADRGLIVAESGFQAGAIRAADHTNITLTSLLDLTTETASERARVQVADLERRIGRLHDATMRAWAWSMRSGKGAIDADDMLTFAGHTFELNSLVLPRIVAGRYPLLVTGAGDHVRVDNVAELVDTLAPRVSRLEAQAEVFARNAHVAADAIEALIGDLAAHISELIAAGRDLPEELRTSDATDRLTRFLTAMRAIGSTADAIKAAAPHPVRKALTKVMRRLCAHTYAVTDHPLPQWDTEQEVTAALLAALRTSLMNERLPQTRH